MSGEFNKIHIIASDVVEQLTGIVHQVRPNWLSETQDHVNLIYTSDLFQPKHSSSLPVFNSRAIETQLSNLNHISDPMIYLNDDMFLCKNHRSSDWFNPLTGLNLNMNEGTMVLGYEVNENARLVL